MLHCTCSELFIIEYEKSKIQKLGRLSKARGHLRAETNKDISLSLMYGYSNKIHLCVSFLKQIDH